MATPLVEGLRKLGSPAIEIDFLCGNSGAAEFLELCFPESTIHTLTPGKRRFFQTISFFLNLRKANYSDAFLCVGIHVGYAFLLKYISGIPRIHLEGNGISLKAFGFKCIKRASGHRVARNLRMVGICNATADKWPVTKVTPNTSLIYFGSWLNKDSILVCIHPGSSRQQGATKRPDVQMLLNLESKIDELGLGWKSVRLFGPAEQELAYHFPEDLTHKNVSVSNLSQLFSILSQSKALIAGDSGYGHLASAAGIPVITLAGPTNVQDTKPWTTLGIVLKTMDRLPCMPCYETKYFYNCPFNTKCMKSISVIDTINSLKNLINVPT